jgi:hypothetical protein
MMSAKTGEPDRASDRRQGAERAEGADGQAAGSRAGPTAPSTLSLAACDLYEELLGRLRRRGYDWG